MSDIDLSNITTLSGLVDAIQGVDEVAVLGNSPHIHEVDFKKVDEMLSIGVNKIGYVYAPDILLWSETKGVLGKKDLAADEEYCQLLLDTPSKVKVARGYDKTFRTPGCILYPRAYAFGHKFEGGLHWGAGIFGACHLAMLANPKAIYIAGVDYAQNMYFYTDRETKLKPESHEFYGTEGFRGEFEKTILPRFADILAACECPIYMCSEKTRVPNYAISKRLDKDV